MRKFHKAQLCVHDVTNTANKTVPFIFQALHSSFQIKYLGVDWGCFVQIGGIAIPLLVSILAAYAGVLSFEKLMAFLGTPLDLSGKYELVAFVTLANPFLIVFALMTLPVSSLNPNQSWCLQMASVYMFEKGKTRLYQISPVYLPFELICLLQSAVMPWGTAKAFASREHLEPPLLASSRCFKISKLRISQISNQFRA